MPGHALHSLLTREALRALPTWAHARLPSEAERLLLNACCMNPDRYFDIAGGGYGSVLPYTLLIDGIQFHYLPNTPIESEYKYWGVAQRADGERILQRVRTDRNENWRHAWTGFNYYLEKSASALRAERFEDAVNYLGMLLHALQDASTFLHSLEGPDGVDIFALDRLMETPPGRHDLLPTSMLSGDKVECDIGGYYPALLGLSVPEAAFRLYSAYARAAAENRRKLVPLLLKARAEDEAGVRDLSAEIAQGAARVSADAVYTVFCLALDRFAPSEVEALRQVHLSDLKPIREPRGLSAPYRFITWLPDAALDHSLKPRPLVLDLGGSRIHYAKGIGSGSHFDYTFAWELPAAVYSRLSGAVGLHPELSRNGDFTAEVRLGGQILLRRHMTDAHSAERFEFSVACGGLLELRVESPFGMGDDKQCVNSIVWGDLKLAK